MAGWRVVRSILALFRVPELKTRYRRTPYLSTNHTLEVCREQVAIAQDAMRRVVCAFDDVRAQILRCQNTFCTVNNLPIEILSYIFRLVAVGGTVCPENLRVASVCSHWRTVSLHDPITWSHLDATSTSNYIELAMRRTQSAPLSIIESAEFCTPHRLVELAKVNIDRVRVLELSGPDIDSLEVFSGTPLPLLHELAFSHDSDRGHSLPLLSGFPITPSLRRLSLCDCMLSMFTIDQSSKEFQRLTNIEIRIDDPWALDGLYESLLALCRATPNLEALAVSSTSTQPIASDLGSQETSPIQPIRMASLHSLYIEVPPVLAVRLSNSLDIHAQRLTDFVIIAEKAEQPNPSWPEQLWTQSCLPRMIFSDLQDIEIRFEFSGYISLDGSRCIGLMDPVYYQNVYIFCELPGQATRRVANYLAPIATYVLNTPMPKLKRLEVIFDGRSILDGQISRRDLRKITGSLYRLLTGFSNLSTVILRPVSAEVLTGLRFRLPNIYNSRTPLFPLLKSCTLQVMRGSAIRSSTIYTLVRQLCPADVTEVRLEGIVFEVRTPQEADEFARDDLPRLAREVWVTDCSIAVKGGGDPCSVESFWPHGSECPLKVGHSTSGRDADIIFW